MTEIDAQIFGSRDAENVIKAMIETNGELDLVKLVSSAVMFRIKGLDRGQGAVPANLAIGSVKRSGILTRDCVSCIKAAINALMGVVQPEDLQAMLLWASGSKRSGPGFCQILFPECGCPHFEQSILDIQAFATRHREEYGKYNQQVLHERGRALPYQLANRVKHLMMEAEWWWAAKDGESSRGTIIAARQLVLTFSKQGQEDASRSPR